MAFDDTISHAPTMAIQNSWSMTKLLESYSHLATEVPFDVIVLLWHHGNALLASLTQWINACIINVASDLMVRDEFWIGYGCLFRMRKPRWMISPELIFCAERLSLKYYRRSIRNRRTWRHKRPCDPRDVTCTVLIHLVTSWWKKHRLRGLHKISLGNLRWVCSKCILSINKQFQIKSNHSTRVFLQAAPSLLVAWKQQDEKLWEAI